MNTTAKGALPVDETIDIEDVNRRMAAGEEVSAEEYMAFVRYALTPAFESPHFCDLNGTCIDVFVSRHEAAGLDDIMELDKSDSRAQQIAVVRATRGSLLCQSSAHGLAADSHNSKD